MENKIFVSIYSQQSAICWETHRTFEEAQAYLELGTEAEALFAIAIYNVADKEIVWKEASLDEETIVKQLDNIQF